MILNEISTIAKNIKKTGGEKGISQNKLSKLTEIAYSNTIKIESGAIQNPSIKTLEKIVMTFMFL